MQISFVLLLNVFEIFASLNLMWTAVADAIPNFKMLMDSYLVWLAGAPAGIKHHRELAEVYSMLGRNLVHASCASYQHLIPWLQVVTKGILFSSCVGGLALGIAMICDVWILLSLPVLISFSGTSFVSNWQLSTTCMKPHDERHTIP